MILYIYEDTVRDELLYQYPLDFMYLCMTCTFYVRKLVRCELVA